METLKELVELAKNATPGKWRRSSTVFNGITATPFSLEFRKEVMLAHCPEKRDAMFIAAANPEAILAIAEEFRALEQQKEAADRYAERLNTLLDDRDATLSRYEAQLAKLAPEGCKLVPVEPTQQMMSQGHFAMAGTDRGKFRRIYQAMVAAAPEVQIES